MILLVKQPINHEYAHFYFAISQKTTTAKTKDTRKIQHNQCHHQYHTSAVHLAIWCNYVPFSPHRYCMCISSTSSLLVSSTPEKHYNFSDLQRLFDLNMKNTLLNLPGVIVMYISSTSSLLVLPIPEKHYKFFRVYKKRLFDLNMKNTSKLPGEKGYLYHPERILDDTICGSPL